MELVSEIRTTRNLELLNTVKNSKNENRKVKGLIRIHLKQILRRETLPFIKYLFGQMTS